MPHESARLPRLRRFAFVSLLLSISLSLCLPAAARAQGLGGAGTVQGTVKDPSGAVVPGATVSLNNAVTGFARSAQTDAAGRFLFRNLPPNSYHLSVALSGFQTAEQDVDVRSSVPIDLSIALALATATTTENVVGHIEDLVESSPTTHTDVDQNLVARLPIEPSSTGLSSVITLAAPGVVADSNGFFHPLGDHAQTQFSIDNQPIADQQSRMYSNQFSLDAVQSMEIITGVPPAEFGDKDSLVVRVITKSGLDQPKPTGDAGASFSTFSTGGGDINFGIGNGRTGNFVSANGMRSNRYLDTPEFEPLHDTGHAFSIFDRIDHNLNDANSFHLNLFAARSSFQVPNDYDQQAAGQDQRQKITSFNIAPAWTRVLSPALLLTANGFVRRDVIDYTPSADPFSDLPATVGQHRTLTNSGGKADLSYFKGHHNVKAGAQVSFTALNEDFHLGLTDPGFNPVCFDADGHADTGSGVTDPAACGNAGLVANDAFQPGLLAFDLTRGGSLFNFNDSATIKQQAAYAQDSISVHNLTVLLGLRFDHYDGLTSKSALQPRVGFSYLVPHAGTVFRASYGRTMETPYNENLLVSSATGSGGLAQNQFGAVGDTALKPGTRDQFNVGLQQAFGKWVVLDVDYFHKKTTNAYDFDTLFNSPIVFPISWDKSKIDGVSARINLVKHAGFSAFTVMGHTRARFFNPENGGIIFDSPLPDGVFRIDHDQVFQQTTNLLYQVPGKLGAWGAFVWRYDSGLVSGSVPDFDTAMSLTAAQQAAIGLYCGGTFATRDAPITSCDSTSFGATRLKIPAPGTEDDDHNPPRVAPRHLFDIGFGVDNLFRTDNDKRRVGLHVSIVNLTDKDALYNFLSTFSGTHFVSPRTVEADLRWRF